MHSPMEDQDCESELPVPGRAAPLFLGVSDGDVGDAPARVRLALWKCLWALDKVGVHLLRRAHPCREVEDREICGLQKANELNIMDQPQLDASRDGLGALCVAPAIVRYALVSQP